MLHSSPGWPPRVLIVYPQLCHGVWENNPGQTPGCREAKAQRLAMRCFAQAATTPATWEKQLREWGARQGTLNNARLFPTCLHLSFSRSWNQPQTEGAGEVRAGTTQLGEPGAATAVEPKATTSKALLDLVISLEAHKSGDFVEGTQCQWLAVGGRLPLCVLLVFHKTITRGTW